jgi:hypothetical protein
MENIQNAQTSLQQNVTCVCLENQGLFALGLGLSASGGPLLDLGSYSCHWTVAGAFESHISLLLGRSSVALLNYFENLI